MRRTINRAVKQRMCLDFDGVIYHNKYKDNRICMDDAPIDGAVDFCKTASGRYKLLVNSARCEDENQLQLIDEYLKRHGIRAEVKRFKPTAHVYIDDRAVRFNGDWGEVVRQCKI